MNATADTVVKLAGVSRLYRQGISVVHALQHINLEIRKDDFVVLVGPPGLGKTTLLNMIDGLDSPTEGHVWVNGSEVGTLGKATFSDICLRKIGFVFQKFNLVPVLPVLGSVEFVMLLQRASEMQRQDHAMTLLKELRLEGMEHRHLQQLSGRQQQRVAIARAITAEPIVVLPDELVANLGSKAGAVLIDTTKTMNRRCGVMFVFPTHDPMMVERVQRVTHLRDDRIEVDERRPP